MKAVNGSIVWNGHLHPAERERGGERAVLITGGAGFIGTNLATRLLEAGRRVIVYDNLSRPGVEHNAAWLQRRFGELVDVRIEDVRDRPALRQAVAEAGAVVHLAAQVAVTTSLLDPEHDLSVNVLGTVGLLEELRALGRPVPMLFTSTNKVYGDLTGCRVEPEGLRYHPAEGRLRLRGVDERQPLSFCSPYGCSKGAAEQYVLDYGRSYGMPTVVFRMSCIYGRRQWGAEDQGWVAHLVRCALHGRPITIFGDGRQVRDLLFADDLVRAMMGALDSVDRVRGRAFNVGGGPGNSVSLLELIELLRQRGLDPEVRHSDWRASDQRWYVSDSSALEEAIGWRPRISVHEGLGRLIDWLSAAPVISDRTQQQEVAGA